MEHIWIDYFVAAFFTFVAVFYTLLIIRKQRAQKTLQCVHMGEKYSLHWINHVTFRVFRVAIWLYCVVRLFIPAFDGYIKLLSPLDQPLVRTFGVFLMMTGFLLALVSNMSLQKSWRSGIDKHTEIQLVTQGLYHLSRNPAYIGVGIAQLGFFLAVPTSFSFVCFLVGWIALSIQIKLEEKHLVSLFGKTYKEYMQDVPRII